MLMPLMLHQQMSVCVPYEVFWTTAAAFVSNQNIGEPCDEVVSIEKSVIPKNTDLFSDT
jgi:hypothetical protein